jgi:hypothetical protein
VRALRVQGCIAIQTDSRKTRVSSSVHPDCRATGRARNDRTTHDRGFTRPCFQNEVQDQDGGRTGARSYDIREAVARREREGAFRTTKTMADEERSHNWTGNYSKGLAARLLSC